MPFTSLAAAYGKSYWNPWLPLKTKNNFNIPLQETFLAQDVLAIEGNPTDKDDMLVVNLNDDDTAYGLKYERLIPVLVNAIKELSVKVTALEAG